MRSRLTVLAITLSTVLWIRTHGLSSRAGGSFSSPRGSARPKPPRLGTVRPTIVKAPTAGKSVVELVAAVNSSVVERGGTGPQGVPRHVAEWFLLDRYFDVRRASEKLLAMASWRRSFAAGVRGVSTVNERKLRKGYLWKHRDKLGRPVVVAVAARHNMFLRRLPESQLLCVEVLEEAINALDTIDAATDLAAIDGARRRGERFSVASTAEEGRANGVTQLLGIFDLRDLSPANVDFEFCSFLIESIYQYYPQRLGQVLLVEPQGFFTVAWEVIRPQLGRHADVVRFVGLNELRSEYFTPETLPDDFR